MRMTAHAAGRPLPQLAGVTHRFLDLAGMRMHVAEAGAGEAVLLLHGFPQHWWEWRALIPRLANDYYVIAPDLRGAGWSDAPPDGYDAEQLMADVGALLERLAVGPVHLIAHDWSGLLGFRLCLERPELVRSYVSLGVPHPWPRFDVRVVAVLPHAWFEPVLATPGIGSRALGRGRQRLARHLLGLAAPGALTDADRETFLAALREPERARAAVALYRRFVLPEGLRVFRGAYRRRRLSTPTAVVIGSADTVVRPWILDGFSAHADAMTTHVVEGATHFVADDRPDEVLRIFYALVR